MRALTRTTQRPPRRNGSEEVHLLEKRLLLADWWQPERGEGRYPMTGSDRDQEGELASMGRADELIELTHL